MKYYDTHAHTNMTPLIDDPNILNNILNEKIWFNCVGTSVESSLLAIQQAKNFNNIKAIIGIHPSDVNKDSYENDLKKIEDMFKINQEYVVAFGETGLDFHYDGYNKNAQIGAFIKHIEMAKKYSKPIIIHMRDAFDDCVEILKNHANGLKVIIHCFSGDIQQAKIMIDLGYFISVPGIITFKNATQLQEAIKVIPLNRLLVETDSPFLSPVPFRGKTNSPINIKIIVNSIAKILNLNEKILAEKLFQNSEYLFGKIK